MDVTSAPGFMPPIIAPGWEPGGDHVGQRVDHLADRMSAGVADGQISAPEEHRDERSLHRIADEIHDDRAANGGNLTNNEREHIAQQENHLSERIYDQRHEANPAPSGPPVSPGPSPSGPPVTAPGAGVNPINSQLHGLGAEVTAGVQDHQLSATQAFQDRTDIRSVSTQEALFKLEDGGGKLTANQTAQLQGGINFISNLIAKQEGA